MTLDVNSSYPSQQDFQRSNEDARPKIATNGQVISKPDTLNQEDYNKYMNSLLYSLQQRDLQIADSVNGNIRSADFADPAVNWTPTINGGTTSGTITYTTQYGWVLRQGLMTDVWFDVSWTGIGAAAGTLYLQLPYLICRSSGLPFVGELQIDNLNLGAGYTYAVITGRQNTYKAEVWACQSGAATTAVAIQANCGIKGHIRYIGVING